MDDDGKVLSLQCPTSTPPNLSTQVGDSQISVSSNAGVNTGVVRSSFT